MFRVGNLHSRSLLGSWPCWPHQHEFVPSCRIIQTSGPRGRWRSDPESIPQFWRQHGGTGPCRDRRGPGGGDCGSGWRKRTRSRTGASLSPEQTRSSGQGAIGQRQPCPRHTTSHRHLIHHMTERGGGCSLYSVFVGYYRGSVSGQGSRSAGDVEIRGGSRVRFGAAEPSLGTAPRPPRAEVRGHWGWAVKARKPF